MNHELTLVRIQPISPKPARSRFLAWFRTLDTPDLWLFECSDFRVQTQFHEKKLQIFNNYRVIFWFKNAWKIREKVSDTTIKISTTFDCSKLWSSRMNDAAKILSQGTEHDMLSYWYRKQERPNEGRMPNSKDQRWRTDNSAHFVDSSTLPRGSTQLQIGTVADLQFRSLRVCTWAVAGRRGNLGIREVRGCKRAPWSAVYC